MATIDYKEKYEQALERARQFSEKPYLEDNAGIVGYIFPELKESEDERIRKALIKLNKVPRKEIFEAEGITKEEALAWIEKQGKQKKVFKSDEMTTLEDKLSSLVVDAVHIYCKENELDTPHCVGLILGDRLAKDWSKEILESAKKELEEIEQKPDDKKGMNLVEEEMTPFQKKVFCIIDTTIEEEQGLKQVCDELLRLAHNEIMQKPAWSEKDEKIKNALYKFLNGEDALSVDGQEAKCWLNELKERVQPQPKQEWSEDDERMYQSIMDDTVQENQLDDKQTEWLRDIKERNFAQPHSQWKPSDEQIIELRRVISGCSYDIEPLAEMAEQLKKLREE